MMKKLITLLSLLLISLAVMPATAEAISLEEIQAKGELVLGTNAEYPPFEWVMMVDGQPQEVGIDIELGQMIADEIGVNLVIDNRSFDSLIPTLQSKKIDLIIAGMSYTEERAKQVAFSNVYNQGVSQFAVKLGEEGNYQSEADFAGKKVGVLQGSIQETYVLEKMPDTEAVSLGKNGDLMEVLKAGRVDAVLIADINLAQYLSLYKDTAALVEGIDVITDGVGSSVAVAKDSTELLEVVNKVIDEAIASGKMEELFTKYTELSAEQLTKE